MKTVDKISSFKYERRKRKQEREIEKYNHRQEDMVLNYKNRKQKSDYKTLLSRLKFETYTKRLVAIVVIVSLVDLQLTYVLAFLGRDQIAETLSNQICITILGTVLVYAIRAYFDTRAEKRDEMIKSGLIVDKNTNVVPKEVIENKIQEIIDNSGISEHINIDGLASTPETENPEDSDVCG